MLPSLVLVVLSFALGCFVSSVRQDRPEDSTPRASPERPEDSTPRAIPEPAQSDEPERTLTAEWAQQCQRIVDFVSRFAWLDPKFQELVQVVASSETDPRNPNGPRGRRLRRSRRLASSVRP